MTKNSNWREASLLATYNVSYNAYSHYNSFLLGGGYWAWLDCLQGSTFPFLSNMKSSRPPKARFNPVTALLGAVEALIAFFTSELPPLSFTMGVVFEERETKFAGLFSVLKVIGIAFRFSLVVIIGNFFAAETQLTSELS